MLREQVDTVEVVGLDEAYLDLTGFERPNAAGRRDQGRRSPSAPASSCSIGIGPNKLVAKVASDADKPDGFLSLTCGGGAASGSVRRSPRLVPGIGPKTAERLEARGITRLDQLGADGRRRPAGLFGGRLGPHLGSLARFEDERELETDRVRKSESRETTFDRDLRGLAQMEPELAAAGEPAVRGPRPATGAAGARSGSRCASTTSRSTPAPAPFRSR